METGKTVVEVTDDLGINETTPASWVSRARRSGAAPAGGSDELERLRRETGEGGLLQHLTKRVLESVPEGEIIGHLDQLQRRITLLEQ